MTEASPALETASESKIAAFSLSRRVEQTLPDALVSEADGGLYRIDGDFRTVLACLRRLSDPNRDALQKRIYLAARFFLNHPPPDMEKLFAAFVGGGQAPGGEEPPLMDFERDAGVLYASFRQQYGIDLLRASLHWVEFRELLGGLTEDTAFGARVRLRELDENRLPPSERARVRRMKERVAIRPVTSERERALEAELNRRLAAGEDPAEIIQQLQEG